MASDYKKIAFFVTEDWYFVSHRLALAIAAKDAGFDVFVITRVGEKGDIIRDAGLTLIPVSMARSGKNPFIEAALVKKLVRIYREIKPDIVHHVALKPVIYGSMAARLAKISRVVNALAGLGFLYSSDRISARVFRAVANYVFRLLLNGDGTRVILQNPDDVSLLCDLGVVDRRRIELIMGSGVDVERYQIHPERSGEAVVLLASRMLWDKGVSEFVAAAKILKQQGLDARFVLVGSNDEANPASISVSQLQEWHDSSIVEWWGPRDDMPEIFARSHIICLPSYREGLPKVLVEAASCGRPIVTTDAPGCREIVKDGFNGILVPVKNADALARAIHTLLLSYEMRARMGQAGRQLVKDKFSLSTVINRTLGVYESMLG